MKSRVLVVEDIPENRSTYEIALRLDGYEVHCASSKAEALSAMRDVTYHAALLDIRLKEGDETNTDGLDIAAAFDAAREGTIIVILSGYGSAQSVIRAYEQHHVFRFLQKEKDEHDVTAVRDAMQQATSAAKLDHFGRYRSLNALLAGNADMQQIWEHRWLDRLGFRGIDEMNEVLRTVFEPVLPILPRANGAELTEERDKCLVATSWSKALGQAILLTVCGNNTVPRAGEPLIRVRAGRFSGIVTADPKEHRQSFVTSIWN